MDTSFPDRLPSFENERRRKTKELTVVTTKERTETRIEERYIDIKTQVNIKRKNNNQKSTGTSGQKNALWKRQPALIKILRNVQLE